MQRAASSYRDPSGQVFFKDGRVFRTIKRRAAADYGFVRGSGLLNELVAAGRLVAAEEVDPAILDIADAEIDHVVEHASVPFWSYAYEWPFAALKQAALFHLQLQLDLLDRDVVLSDASAANVQFIGCRPIFVDLLSLRRYREGEYWTGHRQFCEQFLNPLLLQAVREINPNPWLRGRAEGIPTEDLARLLPLRAWGSIRAATNILLPAMLQGRARQGPGDTAPFHGRPLPRSEYRRLLRQLYRWIDGLTQRGGRSDWQDYDRSHGYTSPEVAAKRRFVATFAEAVRPAMLFDLGCNTGDYADVALAAGAASAVGLDSDLNAADAAFGRAQAKGLDLLVLQVDIADPSPAQGWNDRERQSLAERSRPDAILAMALVHHLAIGRNIPLDEVINRLVAMAPQGVIEFVEKDDPQIRRMLRFREDIFPDYGRIAFFAALETRARIVRQETISDAGRTLVWYATAG